MLLFSLVVLPQIVNLLLLVLILLVNARITRLSERTEALAKSTNLIIEACKGLSSLYKSATDQGNEHVKIINSRHDALAKAVGLSWEVTPCKAEYVKKK